MNNEGTMGKRIPLEIYLYGAVFVLLNGLAYEVDFVPALFFWSELQSSAVCSS